MTTDAQPPLDALIVNVISGKTEFCPNGVEFDIVVGCVRDELPENPPTKEVIFAKMEQLLRKELIVRKPDTGCYVATDLDALAKKLEVYDLIHSIPEPK